MGLEDLREEGPRLPAVVKAVMLPTCTVVPVDFWTA